MFTLFVNLVSVEKYIYARVSDHLVTEYVNFRDCLERTSRRYCREKKIASRTDTNKTNTMAVNAVSQVKLRLSVANFLFWSSFFQLFCHDKFCYLAISVMWVKCRKINDTFYLTVIDRSRYWWRFWYCKTWTQILGFSQTKSLQVKLLFFSSVELFQGF